MNTSSFCLVTYLWDKQILQLKAKPWIIISASLRDAEYLLAEANRGMSPVSYLKSEKCLSWCMMYDVWCMTYEANVKILWQEPEVRINRLRAHQGTSHGRVGLAGRLACWRFWLYCVYARATPDSTFIQHPKSVTRSGPVPATQFLDNLTFHVECPCGWEEVPVRRMWTLNLLWWFSC